MFSYSISKHMPENIPPEKKVGIISSLQHQWKFLVFHMSDKIKEQGNGDIF